MATDQGLFDLRKPVVYLTGATSWSSPQQSQAHQATTHLEQPKELGREAIVADLELTEVHEEDTEKHPGVGELDLSLEVMLRVRCARHIMCLRTLLSRSGQPHHVACL